MLILVAEYAALLGVRCYMHLPVDIKCTLCSLLLCVSVDIVSY